MNNFKCKMGLSDYDAVCPKCTFVVPIVHNYKNEISMAYPYNMGIVLKILINKHIAEKSPLAVKGCIEWKKKDVMSACGCGGTEWCECGYNYSYCIPSDEHKCCFCGRELKGHIEKFKFLTFKDEDII